MHCGSVFGMLPPDFFTSDGREMPQNAGQRFLWQCWVDMAENVGHIDALIVNGDMIDGEDMKSRATNLCLTRPEDQSEAAVQILNYLLKKIHHPKTYCVMGTPYHDSPSGREAEVIAQRIGAEKYHGLGPGRYCRDMLDLEIDGVILNVLHGASGSAGLYRATGPDREGVWSALAGKEGKAARADALLRAHMHFFVALQHPSKWIIQGPAWKLQDGYARKSSAYKFIPDIGYYILEIDGEKKKRKEDPCQLTKKLYLLPNPKVNHL